MSSKPLTYDSQRYVIQNMDPVLRLRLTQRCPSLRCVERTLPYAINYFHSEPYRFTINDTTYNIGIIRIYNNRQTPREICNRNFLGGSQQDVDKYGFPLSQDDQPVNPAQDDPIIARLELNLEYHRLRLEQQSLFAQTLRDREVVDDLIEKVEQLEFELLPFTLRRANADPSFTHYIQLIITSGTSRRVECVGYTRTINEARDYLLERFFGSKGRRVHIYKLEIGSNFDNIQIPLLPLEPGNMEVQHLKVIPNLKEGLDAVRPIISKNPLKSVKFPFSNAIEDPIITSSSQVILFGHPDIKVLLQFSNRNVHLQSCRITDIMVEKMVEQWQRVKLENVVKYSIGFQDEEDVEDLLSMFQVLPDAVTGDSEETRNTRFPIRVILPMGPSSEMNVHCEETSPQDQKFCNAPLIVKVKVQPKRTAVSISMS